MLHWLRHVAGLDSGTGGWYLWWSGVGGDFTELAIVGGIISLYQAKTCDIKGCHRIAHHTVRDTDWSICRKHAPRPRPTLADLEQALSDEELPE